MPFLAPIAAGIAGAVGAGAGTAGLIGAGVSAVGSGVAGAIAGAKGNEQTAGQRAQLAALSGFESSINAGGNNQDIAAGAQAQRDLASTYEQLGQQDFSKGPSAQDLQSSNDLAAKLYGAQTLGVRQNFMEQEQKYSQQAALQGRSPLDPVFRNKQAQEQEKQLGMIQAQQNSFASQRAENLPYQRAQQQLQAAQGKSAALSGLATQALSNRQALAGLGSQAAGIQPQGQGGGLGGALAGGIQGFGAGLSAGQSAAGAFTNPFAQQGLGGMTGDQYFNKYANPANR